LEGWELGGDLSVGGGVLLERQANKKEQQQAADDLMAPKKVFGQTVQANGKGGSGASRYQRQFGNKGGGPSRRDDDGGGGSASSSSSSAAQAAAAARIRGEALDESFGIERFSWSTASHSHGARASRRSGPLDDALTRRGWLYNVLPTTVRTEQRLSLPTNCIIRRTAPHPRFHLF
jgi:hypothetical protein